jgi:hypothetical protein
MQEIGLYPWNKMAGGDRSKPTFKFHAKQFVARTKQNGKPTLSKEDLLMKLQQDSPNFGFRSIETCLALGLSTLSSNNK